MKIHPAPRKFAGLIVAAVVAVTVLSGCLSQEQVTARNLLNADRTANNLPALIDYTKADVKAQAWAEHLAANSQGTADDLSHSHLPDGYEGVSWCRLGENVGMGPTIESIEPAFMASPGHRANILGDYSHVGTGVATSQTTGYVFVVQEFVAFC